MPVVKAGKDLGVLLLPQLRRAGRKPGMVTVVGANDLDLIDAHAAIALSQSAAAEGRHGNQGNRVRERHHEAFRGRAEREHVGSSLSLVSRSQTSPHAARDTGARSSLARQEARRSALLPLAAGAEGRTR